MAQIGRNDPCHCGSGKKYKKCCQARDEAVASHMRGEQSATQSALDWLHEKYPEEVDDAVHSVFMGGRDEDELGALEGLPPHLGQSLVINIGEWLLTDAELSINSKDIPVIDLVLGAHGPRLNAAGRDWLAEIATRSMSLYEVREVKKGEGLLLRDLVYADEAPVWVHEKAATEHVVRWDIFGARLACKDGKTVLTGAVYPMTRALAMACLEEIESEIEGDEDDPVLVRKVVAWTIIDFWLESLLEERPLPKLVDAGTGGEIDLTTDRYRVLNWDSLEKILARQNDVDGDRHEGWTRYVELEDGRRRSLAALNPGKGDILEVFCRALDLADAARNWLEQLAGGVVVYKIREVIDPRSLKALEVAQAVPPPDIPLEVQRQIIHDYLQRHYEGWLDIPLPVLGGKSPLQAVKSKKGRTEVIELLKSIEQLEQRRTAQTGGEAFDVRPLWERLGLNREIV